MPRNITAQNASLSSATKTRPIYIAEIGFSSPMRISSRGDVLYNGNTFVGVSNMSVSINNDGLTGSLNWYNDNFSYSQSFLTEGSAGIAVWIRFALGDFITNSDWDLKFSGELYTCSVKDDISCSLAQPQSSYTPRYYITRDKFRHLTPDGTQFRTSNGVVILARKYPYG